MMDFNKYLHKYAKRDWHELAGNIAYGKLLPPVGVVGTTAGLIMPHNDDIDNSEDNKVYHIIPGYSHYTAGKKQKKSIRGSKYGALNVIAEQLGPVISGGILGGVAGELVDNKPMLGATVGISSSVLLGVIAGLISDKRSKEKQKRYDENIRIIQNLLPGIGSYNSLKRMESV